MAHWADDPAFVRRVAINLDWFDRQFQHILHGHIPTVSVPDQRLKDAIKRAKWALGYPDALLLWGTGVDARFVNALHHPTGVWNPVWITRGLARRRAWRAAHNVEHTSKHGVEFIEGFEGYVANWEDDGFGNRTIGYGHTTEGLRGFTPPLSLREAHRLLVADLAHDYEPAIRSGIHVPLTQDQFDALASFAFNLGTGRGGLADLVPVLNERRYYDAANKMLAYCHANGQVVLGLYRRRVAERNLFLRR